jgi:hypothetical protein
VRNCGRTFSGGLPVSPKSDGGEMTSCDSVGDDLFDDLSEKS